MVLSLPIQQTKATVEFFSNGGIRSTQWWRELAQLLQFSSTEDHYRVSDIAIFSIDGLADTNEIYRRKTNFTKIIENAQTFIDAWGNARWDFLVFKHNEHQLEEAQKIAKEMGFSQFRIRKTSRFAYSPEGPMRFPVINESGTTEYYLEPPTRKELSNQQQDQHIDLIKNLRENKSEDQKTIDCLYKNNFGRIYINSHLNVFPCCFISSDTYLQKGQIFSDNNEKIFNKYEKNFNSLKDNTWDQILTHRWFTHDLVESWNNYDTTLLRCRRTCTKGVNPILSQTQNVLL